jgi:hypothetical protein
LKPSLLPRTALAIAVTAAVVTAMASTPASAATQPGSPNRPATTESARHSGTTAFAKHNVPNPLLKEVFTEQQDDDGGDDPVLSALCQTYLGHPTPYHAITPNIDVINGDTVVPSGSQQGCDAAQNETTISVNPANPRNVVSGTNDYRVFNTREARNDASGYVYTSFDGGHTWKNIQLPHLTFQTGATGALSYMDSAGDPDVVFGPHNTVYYSNLVFSRAAVPAAQQNASGIAVSVSHDGGLTWSEPDIVHLDGVTAAGTATPTSIFNDKEWLAVDQHTGQVYVTWTQFTYDAAGNFLQSPVVVATSHDAGKHWSAPTQMSPSMANFKGGITSFGSGTNPQVADDGSLYVAYETSVCATAACDGANDHDAVVIATSRDGGRTFRNSVVATDYDFPFNNDVANNVLTGENFRINSFPQLAYDAVTNQLWVSWADDRDGRYVNGASVKTNGDVLLAHAFAGGPWSTPLTIGSPSDEVFPAVAALAGQVAVSFYTRDYDPNGIGLDYAYVAGNMWNIGSAPITRLTTQTSNPQVQFVGTGAVSGKTLQGEFIGDYTAVTLGSDFQLHPFWTDFRGAPGTSLPNQDAYTQSISLGSR